MRAKIVSSCTVQKLCLVLCIALAAIGIARSDEPEVTLWMAWQVYYSPPIFPDERENNVRHQTWNPIALFKSERQCDALLQEYGKPQRNVERMCKPIGLSSGDFDQESHFSVCSHLQSEDMALYGSHGSFEPLVSTCDGNGVDRKWTARGVEWYESHPITQSCFIWMRRSGPTFAKMLGNLITEGGGAHASPARSIAAVRAEVARRAAREDLWPGFRKAMSPEQIRSWQRAEAGKKVARDILQHMSDGKLGSWIDGYCTENPGDGLRDAALALFLKLERTK